MPVLLRALTLAAFFVAFVGSGVAARAESSAEAAAPRPTLVDLARARAAAARPLSATPAQARFVPNTVMAPGLAALARLHDPNLFFLYVSAITESGLGYVDVYPAWIRGPHPPLLERISGLDWPSSLAVDRFGTLFVVQTDVGAPVLVFPFMSRKPALKLETEGALPVSVAVAPNGTVYVSTAAQGSYVATVLVYPPGATKPAMNFGPLAGDAVASLQSDALGHIYFAADSIGQPSYVGELMTSSLRRVVNFQNNSLVLDIALDAGGDVLEEDAVGDLRVYGRNTGNVTRTLAVSGSGALSFAATFDEFYTAEGTVREYSYPGGKLLDTITSHAADSTFGVATYPRAPYASAN